MNKTQYLFHFIKSFKIFTILFEAYPSQSSGISPFFQLLEKSFFKLNSFNNNYNVIGDFDYFINLSQKFEIGCVQEPLAYYRIHGNNFSLKKIDVYINELSKWIIENESKLISNNLNLRKQKILLLKLRIKNFLRRLF